MLQKVVIVGAGPTGLLLALIDAYRRHNERVR